MLIGFSADPAAIITPLMPGGSLDKVYDDGRWKKWNSNKNWIKRLDILIGIAEGLVHD